MMLCYRARRCQGQIQAASMRIGRNGMEVDLKDRLARISGVRHAIADAVADALAANGARVEQPDISAGRGHAAILILSHDLKPPATAQSAALVQEAAAAARAMAGRG